MLFYKGLKMGKEIEERKKGKKIKEVFGSPKRWYSITTRQIYTNYPKNYYIGTRDMEAVNFHAAPTASASPSPSILKFTY